MLGTIGEKIGYLPLHNGREGGHFVSELIVCYNTDIISRLNAPVVQWIERQPPKLEIWVRLPSGADLETTQKDLPIVGGLSCIGFITGIGF